MWQLLLLLLPFRTRQALHPPQRLLRHCQRFQLHTPYHTPAPTKPRASTTLRRAAAATVRVCVRDAMPTWQPMPARLTSAAWWRNTMPQHDGVPYCMLMGCCGLHCFLRPGPSPPGPRPPPSPPPPSPPVPPCKCANVHYLVYRIGCKLNMLYHLARHRQGKCALYRTVLFCITKASVHYTVRRCCAF